MKPKRLGVKIVVLGLLAVVLIVGFFISAMKEGYRQVTDTSSTSSSQGTQRKELYESVRAELEQILDSYDNASSEYFIECEMNENTITGVTITLKGISDLGDGEEEGIKAQLAEFVGISEDEILIKCMSDGTSGVDYNTDSMYVNPELVQREYATETSK